MTRHARTPARPILAVAALVIAATTATLAPSSSAEASGARPVTLSVNPSASTAGSPVRLAGKVRHAPRRTKVLLQERTGSGWSNVARTRTRKHGRYAATLVPTSPGSHAYRALARVHGTKVRSKPASLTVAPVPVDQLSLVSRSTAGTGGNGDSSGSSISADGRYVAFTSAANDLVAADTNNSLDVFLRDTATGTTTLVSHNPFGSAAGADSYSPSLSSDGRYLAFTSRAHDLIGQATPAPENVYLWDRATGLVGIVCTQNGAPCSVATNSPSVAGDGTVAYVTDSTVDSLGLRRADGTGSSFVAPVDLQAPRISDDASTIVFQWSDKPGGDYGGHTAIVAWHPRAGTFPAVSKPPSGPPDGNSIMPSVSGDGRYVAYATTAPNLSGVSGAWEIVVTDTVTGVTTLVSRTTDGFAGNAESSRPSISTNGAYVTYNTLANIVPGISVSHYDVVVQSRAGTPARIVSRTYGGVLGNNNSVTPSISADGRFVAFHSQATNLVAADTSPVYDVYRWEALGNR